MRFVRGEKKVSAGGVCPGCLATGWFVSGVYPGWALPGAPSFLSSYKISAKSDNPRPSYGDLTNSNMDRHTTSQIFFRRKRIWIIPHVRRPHFYLHTKFGENILTDGGDKPTELNSKEHSDGGILLPVPLYRTFVCVILQNFS